MGVNGKKDHVPVPMDKLAMAKQMAAKLTAKTATINKSEVGSVTISQLQPWIQLWPRRWRRRQKVLCEGQEGLLDRASLQNLLQVSFLANLWYPKLCPVSVSVSDSSSLRPACCAVECQAELRPWRGRRTLATAGGGGRHLPEVRGGARDQRLPSASQVRDNFGCLSSWTWCCPSSTWCCLWSGGRWRQRRR